MYQGNPVYNTYPTLPPGLAAIPHGIGGLIAPYVGGVAHPYVPVNQSVHDAWMAKYMNDPMYKSTMSRVYGQMGAQIGATVSALPFVDSLAQMTGYAPDQMRKDIQGLGYDFGRSAIGSMFMPIADQALNGLGLTGGSLTASANTILSKRMMMTSPGMLINPFDREQQVSSMAGASAMANLVNGIFSQQNKDGSLSLLPDMSVTQGFDRERIAGLAVRMAGAGAFDGMTKSGKRIGFTDLLKEAAGDVSLDELDFASGDWTGGGDNSVFEKGSEAAEKVHRFAQKFTDRLKSGIEAMGAMRDLLKEVDGIEDKLTLVTNGEWLRSGSGAISARNAARKMAAVTQMYDMDPTQAWNGLIQNRYAMQMASGFDENMQAMGLTGGGMFGLEAQTEFMANVEDMVTARGVRGDPIKADALRKQARYAMAHNMNTQAGVGSQILAWARQNGSITEDEAKAIREGLVSGDRGIMTDSLNRLLTTTFGSASRGRELMQDSMFINSMRQSMTDESGKYAMRTMIVGADSEMMQREKITAANRSLNISREMMSNAGMNMDQTPEGVEAAVASVMTTLKDTNGVTNEADMFKSMYTAMKEKGMKPNEALQATVDAFRANPGTAKFAERIDMALARQYAENNETALTQLGGREATQAKAMTDYMHQVGLIDGKQYDSVNKLLRDNRGEDALAAIEKINAGLDPNVSKMNVMVKDKAGRDFDSALDSIQGSKAANEMLDAASSRGYGSKAIGDAIEKAIAAGRAYSRTEKAKHDKDTLENDLDNSALMAVLGPEEYERFYKGITSDDKDTVNKTMADMGKKLAHLKQFSTDTLRDNGYELPLEGYWGNGIYAGNSADAYERQQSTIAGLAQSFQNSSVINAEDRNTVAQNFYSAMAQKDWRRALGIYDKDNKLRDAGSEYFKLFEDYSNKRDEFDKTAGDVRKVIRGLAHGGKAGQADLLRKYMDDVDKWKDEDIQKVLDEGGVNDESKKKVMEAVAKKREMLAAQKASEEKVKELGKDEKFVEQAKVFSDKIGNANYRKKRRISELSSYMDSIDVSKIKDGYLSALWDGSSDLYNAYQKVNDIISDDELAKSKGLSSLEGYDAIDIKQGKIDLAKKKAMAGDEAAISAMEQFKVASDKGVTRIRGEIILKNGDSQQPAILECMSEVRA